MNLCVNILKRNYVKKVTTINKSIMKCLRFLLIILCPFIISCSTSEEEDKIITDLNDIFDPKGEGDTDWNYTEIDADWMEDLGIYFDYSIGKYRQKFEYAKLLDNKKKSREQINPITLRLYLLGIIFLLFIAWLIYATYCEAIRQNRIIWLWIVNSLLGGVSSFIILSLSRVLKYDNELGYREETDFLGITILLGNIVVILTIFLVINTYNLISNQPDILRNFLKFD